jgi:hypothetical protein
LCSEDTLRRCDKPRDDVERELERWENITMVGIAGGTKGSGPVGF